MVTNIDLTADEAAILAERTEAQYFERFQLGAPKETRRKLGIRSRPVGDGTAVAMRADTSNFWNKALGFASPGAIDEAVVALHPSAGVGNDQSSPQQFEIAML